VQHGKACHEYAAAVARNFAALFWADRLFQPVKTKGCTMSIGFHSPAEDAEYDEDLDRFKESQCIPEPISPSQALVDICGNLDSGFLEIDKE